MAYTLTIGLALGSSQTGLTLQAQLVDTAGANVGAAVTTGFVEIAGGAYQWTYAAFPDGHRGGVKVSTSPGGVFKAYTSINPEEAENTDVKTSTRAAAGVGVTVATNDPGDAGEIEIIRGDDYNDADGRAFQFTVTGAPDLTTASAISFTLVNRVTGTALAVSVLAGVTATVIKVPLTAAQTAGLALGNLYVFDIQATFSGRKRTLVEGTATVVQDYAA